MKLTTLSDKAILVKLTARKASLYKRDQVAEAVIQQQMDDASLIVNSKLFRDKLNPINQIMNRHSEVYTYHKAHTLAYIDKGPRLLPNTQYLDYTTAMRGKIAAVEALLVQHIPNYDQYVQLDIAYRSKSPSSRAKVDDYPTADEFYSRMGFDLRFMPLPESRHFLFDISQEDMDTFNDTMSGIAESARVEVLKKMLEPLKHLIEKLNKPIGTDGAIFRDATVENVLDGVEMAKKLNITGDQDVFDLANSISQAVSVYASNVDVLRESPVVRAQAAQKLDYIAQQMGAMYGQL